MAKREMFASGKISKTKRFTKWIVKTDHDVTVKIIPNTNEARPCAG